MSAKDFFVFDFKDLSEDYLDIIEFRIKNTKGYELEFFKFLFDWFDNSNTISSKTSGSTGKPKSIKLLKTHMIRSALNTIEFINDTNIETSLLCLPLEHIAAKMMVIRSIIIKSKIIVSKPSSNPLENIDEQIDICSMVPMQVSKSIDKLENIKYLLIGGAPIDIDLDNKLKRLKTISFHTYGMTETYSHVAIRKINDENKNFQAVKKDITFKRGNDDCLLINYPHLNLNHLQTNDIVKIIDKNNFKWIGRKDNVINSGGVKIITEVLETKLKKTIKGNLFIHHIPDKLLNQRLILVLEGKERDIKFDNSIKKYEKPKKIYFVKRINRTKTGKIKRLINKKDIIYIKTL